MKKRLSILGSTGSIGVNTLEVVSQLKDEFDIIYLSTNKNTDLLLKQIKEFDPKFEENVYTVFGNFTSNTFIDAIFFIVYGKSILKFVEFVEL